jgi:hypothetical protein
MWFFENAVPAQRAESLDPRGKLQDSIVWNVAVFSGFAGIRLKEISVQVL